MASNPLLAMKDGDFVVSVLGNNLNEEATNVVAAAPTPSPAPLSRSTTQPQAKKPRAAAAAAAASSSSSSSSNGMAQQQPQPKKKARPSSSTSREEEEKLAKLGLLPSAPMTMVCKPVNPTAGLKLGDRPITMDELLILTPDEMEDEVLTRNGEPLSIAQLADLLDMPEEFAEMIATMDVDDD